MEFSLLHGAGTVSLEGMSVHIHQWSRAINEGGGRAACPKKQENGVKK